MRHPFLSGVGQAFPIVVGYYAVAIPFGILSTKMGLPIWVTICMSLIVFAGASQFVALELLAGGLGIVPIALATFVINLRHFLMSMSLGCRLPRLKKRYLLYIGETMTDESYGVNIAKQELNLASVLGTNMTAHLAWSSATAIGAVAGQWIPFDIKYFSGALPIMFVTLLALQLKTKADLALTLLAIFLTLILMFVLPGKWPFLVSALMIPTAAVFFKRGNNNARE